MNRYIVHSLKIALCSEEYKIKIITLTDWRIMWNTFERKNVHYILISNIYKHSIKA